jgi:hypothetical protein
MSANGDAPRSAFAPSEPILHEVNLAARGRNFESEARKVKPPDFESGGWRFEPCRARQLANSTANTLGAIGCATRKGGRRQTCRPSLLRSRLHSLRALLAGLIPMHAGLFAGGLGLWRSERWRAEGHHEGQGKHRNESLHRVCYASQDGSTILRPLSLSGCFPMSRLPRGMPKKRGAGGLSSGPSF